MMHITYKQWQDAERKYRERAPAAFVVVADVRQRPLRSLSHRERVVARTTPEIKSLALCSCWGISTRSLTRKGPTAARQSPCQALGSSCKATRCSPRRFCASQSSPQLPQRSSAKLRFRRELRTG